MKQLVNEADFFAKYNINADDFAKTNLTWEDLSAIYIDYCKTKSQLESSAVYMFNELMKLPSIHSVI